MKYIIPCPECKTEHDVSKQMLIWQRELFEDIKKFIQKKIKDTSSTKRVCIECGKENSENGWCPDCEKCWDCLGDEKCKSLTLCEECGNKIGLQKFRTPVEGKLICSDCYRENYYLNQDLHAPKEEKK